MSLPVAVMLDELLMALDELLFVVDGMLVVSLKELVRLLFMAGEMWYVG
jgi:hypothetical protein